MAISPPSDILLDVATAADPAKVRAATERLAKLAADPAAKNEGFSKALAAAGKPGGTVAPDPKTSASTLPVAVASVRAMAQVKPLHGKSETYQKFEGLMLQNFVETMLPKDDELFGDKASAAPYRSMLAEQLASQIAKAGGIGIAKTIEAAHPAPNAHSLNTHSSNAHAPLTAGLRKVG